MHIDTRHGGWRSAHGRAQHSTQFGSAFGRPAYGAIALGNEFVFPPFQCGRIGAGRTVASRLGVPFRAVTRVVTHENEERQPLAYRGVQLGRVIRKGPIPEEREYPASWVGQGGADRLGNGIPDCAQLTL